MMTKIFRLGELFCGPGGLAYGALHSQSQDGLYRIKHAWANDFDLDTCETYRRIFALTLQKLFIVKMSES